jgi:hypothetical protein
LVDAMVVVRLLLIWQPDNNHGIYQSSRGHIFFL